MFMSRWVCVIEQQEKDDSLLNYANQTFYLKNEKVDEPLLLSIGQIQPYTKHLKYEWKREWRMWQYTTSDLRKVVVGLLDL